MCVCVCVCVFFASSGASIQADVAGNRRRRSCKRGVGLRLCQFRDASCVTFSPVSYNNHGMLRDGACTACTYIPTLPYIQLPPLVKARLLQSIAPSSSFISSRRAVTRRNSRAGKVHVAIDNKAMEGRHKREKQQPASESQKRCGPQARG